MSEQTQSGTIETKKDMEGEQNVEFCRNWLSAIELSSKTEDKWRKRGEKAYKIYRAEEKEEVKSKRAFNILYPNTETLKTAVYNSQPVPDIRRRYGDDDPDAKAVADILERSISYEMDTGDGHSVIKAAVGDMVIPGRGVARIRYEPVVTGMPVIGPDGQPTLDDMMQPVMTEQITDQKCKIECVQWDDFRRGPGKTWADVSWVAFRHYMTRDQLNALSPEVGPRVTLDVTDTETDKDKPKTVPDMFKRAEVWEIWDKDAGEQIFIAKCYPQQELRRGPPEVKYDGFFPVPKPLYAVQTSNSLIPVDPYRYYEDQAEELNSVTIRIDKLIKVLKFRGIGSAELNAAIEAMKSLDDGQIASVTNSFQLLQAKGGLDAALWIWPVEKIVIVLQSLYEARDKIKQTIYEITGISDILRGSVNPNEKLGQSQIKAQWGSLRIDDMQSEVARLSRDLFRMMAGVIAEYFQPEILQRMTGIQLTPQQVQLMRDETLLSYRIDIETDSTIRADLTRNQQNVAQFVQGFGQFITSVGPAVQAGIMPVPTAVEMVSSFARIFKLGRQVEMALEKMKKDAMQPKPPPGPDPEQAIKEKELALKDKEISGRQQIEQGKLVLDAQKLEYDKMTADQTRKDQLLPDRENLMKENEMKLEEMQQGFAALAQALQQNTQVLAQIGQGIMQSQQAMTQALTAPRKAVRGPDGKISHTETVMH